MFSNLLAHGMGRKIDFEAQVKEQTGHDWLTVIGLTTVLTAISSNNGTLL